MGPPWRCVVFGCLLGPACAQTFAPLTRPSAVGSPAAFDTVRRRLVMFDTDGTTWELDGGTLLPRTPPTGTPQPLPRAAHAMGYDEARRRVLMFGGSGIGGTTAHFDDTWAYDGNSWTQLTGGPTPSPRRRAAITWDATRNRMVMWGGTNASSQLLNDTWEHDGSTWLQRSPATSPPLGGGAMAFDRQRSVAVLVLQPDVGQQAETWEWNGTSWALRATLGNVAVDGFHTLAFDPARNRTVLAGSSDRIHEWDGTSWSASAVLPQPFLRLYATSWFDPGCGCVTFAGGIDRISPRSRADQWRWNGQALTPAQDDPGPRAFGGVMVADPPRGRVVHFGGMFGLSFSAETWALANGTWSAVPSLISPSARSSAQATHDLLRGESVLFGGFGLNGVLGDTWTLGSAGWVARSTTGPSPRTNAAMAADLVRGVIVLFGGAGSSLHSDTWEWNGALWTQRASTAQPGPRAAAAMAFHPQLGRIMLFGGAAAGATILNDTWTWDGSQWTELTPATRPPPLTSLSMSSDPSGNRCILVGASSAIPVSLRQQAWTHDGTNWQLTLDQSVTSELWTPCATGAALDTIVCSNDATPAAAFGLTFTPGRVAAIGAGCGSPASTLMVRSRPRPGATTGLELVANPARAVLFALDLSSGNTPLGGGCTLWLGASFVGLFQISSASGFAEQPLSVPANPALRGLHLFAQAAVLEPMSSNGLVLTEGLRLTVGD